MKRLKHLFCFGYLWEIIDPKWSMWQVRCTKCGYEKDL